LYRYAAEAAGVGAAGAHQICIQVWWVTLFALDALAVAAQSLVAAALGAGDVAAARSAADRTLLWALAAGTAVGVGIFAAGPLVPALFTSDADISAAAEGPLRLVAVLQPLNAAVFVGDGVGLYKLNKVDPQLASTCWLQILNLKCDILVSKFAFSFNLYRYNGVLQGAAGFDYLALAMAAAAAPALGLLATTGGAAAGGGVGALGVGGLGAVWRSMALLQVGRAATLAARYWGADGPVSLPAAASAAAAAAADEAEEGKKEEDDEDAAR
jgi:predicted secreted protein